MSDLIERLKHLADGDEVDDPEAIKEAIDQLVRQALRIQGIEELQAQLANITALCSQEGNDGEPWGTIYALAERNK